MGFTDWLKDLTWNNGAQLEKSGRAIKAISEKTDYRDISSGYSSGGLILIYGVDGSLGGVAANLFAAANALQSGLGMDRRAIGKHEIGDGLRRMREDIWGDASFRAYMRKNLTPLDFDTLSNAFETVETVCSKLLDSF